jgi:hypothetical protein
MNTLRRLEGGDVMSVLAGETSDLESCLSQMGPFRALNMEV